MKPGFLLVLCLLLWQHFIASTKAQSMASNFLDDVFKLSPNLQRQLGKQQLAHEQDRNTICMVTVYPDQASVVLTDGFFVIAQKTYTEFEQGPMRGHESGPSPLPDGRTDTLKVLLAQLPPPTQANSEKRQVIISSLISTGGPRGFTMDMSIVTPCKPSSESHPTSRVLAAI